MKQETQCMPHGREGASFDPVNMPRILTESRTS
jgi:hypothetical protein